MCYLCIADTKKVICFAYRDRCPFTKEMLLGAVDPKSFHTSLRILNSFSTVFPFSVLFYKE